jgi:hypothetical protein
VKKGKRKFTGAQYVKVLLLFVLIVGFVLLVVNGEGSDKTTKMNWGVGAGLVIGSISYFVEWIVTKARAKYRDNQVIFIILLYTFLIAGFIVLYGYNDGLDDWRLLGLGTGLWVGGLVFLAKYADIIKPKTVVWIVGVGFVLAIVTIVVESVIT